MKYVGIDLGKKQSQACWMEKNGEITHRRISTTPEELTRWFPREERARILLEASSCSEWVARHLESLGHEVIVADPNHAPMYAERTRRIKTDRRDAEALLMACIRGTWKAAHRLSDGARLMRACVGSRRALVKSRTELMGQVTARLTPWNLSLGKGEAESLPSRFEKAELPLELRAALSPVITAIEALNASIAKMDGELTRLTREDEDVKLVASVPGIGKVTAATYVAYLDRPDRFAGSAQVSAFLGLVPSEWSSSEVQRRGHITKAGPGDPRALLVEAAWHVLMHPRAETEGLRQWAKSVTARRGRKVAVVALARRLGRIAFAVWRDRKPFDETRYRASEAAPA